MEPLNKEVHNGLGTTDPENSLSSIFIVPSIADSAQPEALSEVPTQEPVIVESVLPALPKKKERKLKLPKAILGAKPGVVPNTKYLKQEGDSHRKTHTASTAYFQKSTGNLILIR